MAYTPLQAIINKQDSFEIIRDQIGAILLLETANQMALAPNEAPPLEPDDFKLRIFLERANPWQEWQNIDVNNDPDLSPIVNVWYDSDTADESASNTISRQAITGTFNIDCYGYGTSKDDGGSGHEPGDKKAAFESHRAVRLVRNILMAGENTYLQLQGLVWQRRHQSRNFFQPEINGVAAQNVLGARFALRVKFNETSSEFQGENLELLTNDVKRVGDELLIAEADVTYPL